MVSNKVIVTQTEEQLIFKLFMPSITILTGIKGFINTVNIVGKNSINPIIFNGEMLNEQGIQKFWKEIDRIFADINNK